MASKLYSRFSTDQNKEEAGVWVDFGDGVRIRIRRLNSRRSQEVRNELNRPHADTIRRGPLPSDVAEELMLRQIARGIISDWEGVDLGDGVSVPYTGENAYKLLKDLPEIRDHILQVSSEADNFRAKVDEDTEKNLPPISDGV
jgi:hypothetical protein